MAEIEWEKPKLEKTTLSIEIDTDENGDLDKIRMSDDWNRLKLPQRIKVFSRLISDLHFFVDLEQFRGIQLQYAGDQELRAANRKIQAEIKGKWQEKQNKKKNKNSSIPKFRLS